jgi:TolA-binding protein
MVISAVVLIASQATAYAWPCAGLSPEACAQWNDYENRQNRLQDQTNQSNYNTQLQEQLNRLNNSIQQYNYYPYNYRR